ncbi:MAG TPA: universal stress protein [Deltaproteobacteria bacterium]|nr:universal stress protein [Deltaproteobacteria bacterium]HPR56313.1 universal stress protein [Deltaproteobacteria bacterium]HXK46463.1 universal stress protein [Deltaproteobacteria bacterium]
MFNPKKILVPTDFSASSDRAVEYAADMGAAYGARVMVLHVMEENVRQCAIDYLVDYCLEDDFVTRFEREILKSANERLDRQVAALKDAGKGYIEFEIKKGDPVDTILEEQVRLGADLLVISSQGKAGSARHTLGSVTDKVVRTSGCPVLVVRT